MTKVDDEPTDSWQPLAKAANRVLDGLREQPIASDIETEIQDAMTEQANSNLPRKERSGGRRRA